VRLFVAVWPDDPTRKRLAALAAELGQAKGLRFVAPTHWHVTLRFLGDVDDDLVDPLSEALLTCTTATTPVECRLGPGTAWFIAARVLQLPAAGVDELAEAVRRATTDLVPPPQSEPTFSGHLTPARARDRRLGVAALGEMANIPFEAAFPVTAFDLVASVPSPEGHIYTTLA